MIFNSSETSESVSNGVILKMYSFVVYKKSFEGQKGGSSEPPRTPPAYRPVAASRHTTRVVQCSLASVGLAQACPT